MEPLDDHELKQLLREWTSPPAPRRLGSPWTHRGPLRGWLTGSIAIPAPVALAALVAFLAYLAWSVAGGPPAAPAPAAEPIEPESAVVSLSGFRTVSEVVPRRVGGLE